MLPYRWTSIEPERHDKDTEGGAIRDTKDTRGASLHLEKEGAHKPIDPPTGTLHQEGHVSNADKWATSPETAQGGRSRRTSTSSTTMTTSQSAFRLFPCHETAWPR